MSQENETENVTKNDHVQGSQTAPVVMIEYGDYQCPYCGAAHPMIKKLQEHFGDKLTFVFRNFPLVQAHPQALSAALAAEAAGLQGKFWEMHDMIYDNRTRLDEKSLQSYARKLQLDLPQFQKDMKNPELIDRIRKDLQSGESSGVEGTPSFYINGHQYRDAYDYGEMKNYIDGLLGSHNESYAE